MLYNTLMRLTDALQKTRFITRGSEEEKKKPIGFYSKKIPIAVETAQLREMRRSGGEKVKEDLIFDDVLFAQIYTRRRRRLTRLLLTHLFIYFLFFGFVCKPPPALPD